MVSTIEAVVEQQLFNTKRLLSPRSGLLGHFKRGELLEQPFAHHGVDS
ncbi:MAG: hypothetical protein QOK16_4592 [Solirubrobacteraceae bacterium]|jgi:hypothetical protein|nr:hypothetical protein [Solirubrobacteraceae bacterium]